MNHTQLLNFLADKIKAKSYLELGIQSTQQNFDKIKVPVKVGVDPAVPWGKNIFTCTSDRFFDEKMKDAQYVGMGAYPSQFDLIFIDGLHTSDQVEKDFANSLKVLNKGGFIVIHDVLPEDEITTCVPRGEQKMWHGDVYKWAMKVYSNYQDVDFVTYSFDNGCMVCWKSQRQPGPPFTLLGTNFWDFYKENREAYMKVRDVVSDEHFFGNIS